MSDVGLEQLLEAGVHFGHQTRRWNPKMKPFIFTERNGIHIIDLRKTLDRLKLAQQAAREVVLRGDKVLYHCTKKQLRSVIETEAEESAAFFVTERWLGGMLTNFQTIRKQIRRLKELERGQQENAFESAKTQWEPSGKLSTHPQYMSCTNYGPTDVKDLFMKRQALALSTFSDVLDDFDVFFLTGTDEHGLKIQNAAKLNLSLIHI